MKHCDNNSEDEDGGLHVNIVKTQQPIIYTFCLFFKDV